MTNSAARSARLRRKKAARYRRNGRREKQFPWGGAALLLIAALALFIRFSPGEFPQQIRQTVSMLVQGEMDLQQAVAVFGKNAVSETEKKENAIVVFGKKLLGIKQDDMGASEASSDFLPAQANDFDEYTPQEGTVGNDSDRTFSVSSLIGVCESPSPIIDPNTLKFDLPAEEMQDDTSNVPFHIPSPDVVDDTFYPFTSPCAAPLRGRITSPFGYRDHPIDEKASFHYGVDIAASAGTSIKAFAAGRVTETGKGTVYGNYVRIDHGNGFTSFYGHMQKITAKKGAWIALGAEVGKVGSTGKSTGPHLHFEMRKNGKIINPSQYVELSA